MKQAVSIEVGEKRRSLRYTFNSLIALEEELGIPIANFDQILSNAMSLKHVRALLWAGLLHEDKSLSPEEVGEWIDISQLNAITSKIEEAISLSFGSGDEKKKETTGGETKKKT